jgi:hypothetical protein
MKVFFSVTACDGPDVTNRSRSMIGIEIRILSLSIPEVPQYNDWLGLSHRVTKESIIE